MGRWWALGCGLLAVLAVADAGARTPADWDTVITAAKKEGRVVLYSAYVSPDTHDAIAKAFDKAYGIKIDLLSARGGEVRERARAEQAAGRFLADVSHNPLTGTEIAQREEKPLAPHGGVPNAARVRDEFKAKVTDLWVPIFTINYGFLINTGLVKAGDEPKSWADLTDPKWKGKILSDETRASGGGRVMFHMTYDTFGAAFHEKLAAQGLVFARDYRESTRRVARGEYPIYIPFILSDFPNLKGLPVKYVIPAEGATYGSYAAGVYRNAPHPNAARLLVDFFLSDEVQMIYARSAHGIMLAQPPGLLSPEILALSGVKPLVAEDFSTIQQRLDQAKAIYK